MHIHMCPLSLDGIRLSAREFCEEKKYGKNTVER